MPTRQFLIIARISLDDDWQPDRLERFIRRHFKNKHFLVKETHSVDVQMLPRAEDNVERIRRRPAETVNVREVLSKARSIPSSQYEGCWGESFYLLDEEKDADDLEEKLNKEDCEKEAELYR